LVFVSILLSLMSALVRPGTVIAQNVVPSPSTAPLSAPEQQELDLLEKQGVQALQSANFPVALKAFQDGLDKAQSLQDKTHIAVFLNRLGSAHIYLGQFDQALDCLTHALELENKLTDLKELAITLNNLGRIYHALGQFGKALDCLTHALELENKLNNPKYKAASLINLGDVYHALGQFDKALDCLTRALELENRISDPRNKALSFEDRGDVYLTLGQFDKALEDCARALEIVEKLNNPRDIAKCQNTLGNVYLASGQFDKARDCFMRTMESAKKVGTPEYLAWNLSNMGRVCFALGQYDNAYNYHSQALELENKLGNQQYISLSLNCLGLIQEKRGNVEDASAFYQRALDLYENLTAQISEASDTGAFQEVTLNNLYTRCANLYLRQNRPEAALALLDRGRGQGLAKQAEQNRVDMDSLLSPEDSKQLRERADALTQAERQLRIAQDRNQSAEDRLKNRNQTQSQLAAFRQGLFAQEKYASYRRMKGARPPAASELLDFSRQYTDTLYLEYGFLDNKTMLLFALHDGKLQSYTLSQPLGKELLPERLTKWRQALIGGTGMEIKLAQKLYQTLLGKVSMQGATHLVIVADGPLLDTPFAALADVQGKRLIERLPVSYAFSLASLTWKNQNRAAGRRLLCVADPTGEGGGTIRSLRGGEGGSFPALPNARVEGATVVRLFDRSLLLTGEQAIESVVRKEMPNYALLHFATHAEANGKQGLLSFLALAPDQQDSGILEAREIAGMRLSAQLATLSACETGAGQKSGGEGLLGLAWAFRAAGCPAIVASQWAVSDKATKNLMVAFYRGILAGKRKDDALRSAMLTVKKDDPQPYFWAGFQMMGDTGRL
jgi:CHAT domain-containing protein/tetratricopeptide (TPR) repeat protein